MDTTPQAKGLREELRTVAARGKQVWGLVARRDKLVLAAAALIMSVVGAASAAVKKLLGLLVDAIQRIEDEPAAVYRTAVLFLGVIAALYVTAEILQVVRKYLVQNTTTRIEKETTVKLIGHLLKVDLATLSGERVGALHGRISRSVEGFVKFIKLGFQDLFPAFFLAGFALLAVLLTDWRIGLLMVGVVPAATVIVIRQVISQKGIRLELMRTREGLDGTVVEQLGGIEYIRAANTHRREAERVAAVAEMRRAKEIKHHMAMATFDCLKALNEGLFLILVIGASIYLAARGAISYGKIMEFALQFMAVTAALREMHRILDDAHESSLRVGDLLGMLNVPADRSFSQVTLREPALTRGAALISAQGLTVDYRLADGTAKRALTGATLTIAHGQTIGAAGPSASGKSTWLRVLMRLIHPSAGTAALGGVAIEALSRESIARLIGYVGQTPFIFAGTVMENIAYGMDNVGEEEIRRAAQLACIHDEILAMPGGYQAPVNERGQNLSGGQRQRLALARVFLKNPPLLILDEATSALDNISEHKVQQAIIAARADRTVILVAHRLSTLREADSIFVFDAGKIVEVGTYDELLDRGGVFTELVHKAEEPHARA